MVRYLMSFIVGALLISNLSTGQELRRSFPPPERLVFNADEPSENGLGQEVGDYMIGSASVGDDDGVARFALYQSHCPYRFGFVGKLGEKLRVPGGVYELVNIRIGGGKSKLGNSYNIVYFKRCPEYEIDDSDCYPLSRGGVYKSYALELQFIADKIDNATKAIFEAKKPPAAVELPDRKSDKLGKQLLREGELLWIGNEGFKVTKIVPPDPKIKLQGWIEFAKKPSVTIEMEK